MSISNFMKVLGNLMGEDLTGFEQEAQLLLAVHPHASGEYTNASMILARVPQGHGLLLLCFRYQLLEQCLISIRLDSFLIHKIIQKSSLFHFVLVANRALT